MPSQRGGAPRRSGREQNGERACHPLSAPGSPKGSKPARHGAKGPVAEPVATGRSAGAIRTETKGGAPLSPPLSTRLPKRITPALATYRRAAVNDHPFPASTVSRGGHAPGLTSH